MSLSVHSPGHGEQEPFCCKVTLLTAAPPWSPRPMHLQLNPLCVKCERPEIVKEAAIQTSFNCVCYSVQQVCVHSNGGVSIMHQLAVMRQLNMNILNCIHSEEVWIKQIRDCSDLKGGGFPSFCLVTILRHSPSSAAVPWQAIAFCFGRERVLLLCLKTKD